MLERKGFKKKIRKWRKRLDHPIGLRWRGQTAVDLLQEIAEIMHKGRENVKDVCVCFSELWTYCRVKFSIQQT